MIKSWLDTLDTEEFVQLQMNFSSRTTSLDFQKALEDNIDKRIGRVYGPPSNKVLKVFLDDLHMPVVSGSPRLCSTANICYKELERNQGNTKCSGRC